MRRTIPLGSFVVTGLVGGLGLLAGCSPSGPTTQPASLADRQSSALADPYGYASDSRKSDMTVSGHGGFDKEGFDRDKDFVLNP
jgi:hypothetical protein